MSGKHLLPFFFVDVQNGILSTSGPKLVATSTSYKSTEILAIWQHFS